MKRIFTVILIAVVTATLFSSCKKEEDGGLSGTFVAQSIYDWIYYLNDGTSYSLRNDDFITEGQVNDMFGIVSQISFRFTGSSCYLIAGGMESASASYTLSGDRLTIKDSSMTLTFGYKTSPQTMFVWDLNTLRSMGADVSEFTQLGITDFELWVAMRKK